MEADEIPTPVAEAPSSPALPVPNPAPLPPTKFQEKFYHMKISFQNDSTYWDAETGRLWVRGWHQSEKRPTRQVV